MNISPSCSNGKSAASLGELTDSNDEVDEGQSLGCIQNMDPGPWTTRGAGPWTTSVDPIHGPPLAEHVFRRMHVETMEEGEITHCFLNFWIRSFVNILRSIRG